MVLPTNPEKDSIWVAEQNAARLERANKRSFILNIILIMTLAFSYVGFFAYESQFTDEKLTIEAEQQADGDSSNFIIGGNYGGQAEGENH